MDKYIIWLIVASILLRCDFGVKIQFDLRKIVSIMILLVDFL